MRSANAASVDAMITAVGKPRPNSLANVGPESTAYGCVPSSTSATTS